ncbi:unnamed protein product (macronuclear) [Paramecium tetraurelia]|uniref:t-SNARE coiled-coil homology domain-containing protein n=1 Tax=Paramecium tetraurelia TaxID=5888 RepID=A0CG48_PARTE|nr:uncharacterized protein GSPATT00038209001 [Paramecium tetraurelia]CAK69765.1 unnamed protein product [Paramecium tetraurelia]|eukprot:XP_001437162.1 hypothetical protein (macronuclear) [Paramecium tetraurelia strain d4-2]
MAASLHIQFYLDKLMKIDHDLGGTAAAQKKTGDDFISLKDSIHNLLFKLRSKIEEKHKYANVQRNQDAIKLDIEIRDLITDIERLLDRLNEALRKQSKDKKKYPEQNIQAKQKAYSNYRQQLYDLQQLLDPNAVFDQQQTNNSVETVSTLKMKLMDQDGRKPPPSQQMSQEEKDAIQRWKQNDELMDKQLDNLVDGTQKWKENAMAIGGKIDHTSKQIDHLTVKVDETNAELYKQNSQLKKIVEKYRQPNKFCLDMVLVFILIGLCGVIYVILK